MDQKSCEQSAPCCAQCAGVTPQYHDYDIVTDAARLWKDRRGDDPQLAGYTGTGETKIPTKVTLRARDRSITKLIKATSWTQRFLHTYQNLISACIFMGEFFFITEIRHFQQLISRGFTKFMGSGIWFWAQCPNPCPCIHGNTGK